jgi:TRAP-type C4-dicarboxylate transport system permease small subunit
MKKIANSLMPLAVLALFLTCLASLFSLLVVLMASVGFADGVPWSYYQKLNIGVISVALPIAGMILFTAILLGLPRKRVEAVKPTVVKGDIVPLVNARKQEEHLPKAA